MITQKLSQKGLKATVIAKALSPEESEDDPQLAEIKAAYALAKRRGLGPFRKALAHHDDDDQAVLAKRAAKDVMTLARAGFPF